MQAGIQREKVRDRTDYDYVTRLLFNESVMNMNMGRVFTPEEADQYFTFILKRGGARSIQGVPGTGRRIYRHRLPHGERRNSRGGIHVSA